MARTTSVVSFLASGFGDGIKEGTMGNLKRGEHSQAVFGGSRGSIIWLRVQLSG